jgi:hypothetical protein
MDANLRGNGEKVCATAKRDRAARRNIVIAMSGGVDVELGGRSHPYHTLQKGPRRFLRGPQLPVASRYNSILFAISITSLDHHYIKFHFTTTSLISTSAR